MNSDVSDAKAQSKKNNSRKVYLNIKERHSLCQWILRNIRIQRFRSRSMWRFVSWGLAIGGISMGEDQAAVISEQLGRLEDNIESRFQKIEAMINHQNQISEERMRALRTEVGDLKKAKEDHETRIRSATEGVTQFKMYSGLANGGSGLLSIIALVKSFFGG